MTKNEILEESTNGFPFPLEKSVDIDLDGEKIKVGLRPMKESDSESLVKLFKENYKGGVYEISQVYSADWWKEQTNNPHVYSQVVVTSLDEVIGSFIIDKEEAEGRIEIGKVTIDSRYQGNGIASRLGPIAIFDVMNSFPVDLMYSEARTNKPSTQRPLYVAGILPVAIMPNKLSVTEGLETSLLMASVLDPEKRTRRRPELLDNLKDFYEISAENFDIAEQNGDPPASLEGYAQKEISYVEIDECSLKKTNKSNFCTISCPTGKSPTEGSLQKLISKMESKGIKSFFSEASPYSVEEQKIWLEQGFVPVGYCPSWKVVDGEREDTLFMFRGELPDREQIFFAEVYVNKDERKYGTWFLEPTRPLIEAVYRFQ